ncbi:MAG: ribosome biogenesis GTPase Der [Betaproteobacteria bacterium]|nr:ribosome biogenesis GTPase Der [Betaproteobacteria bacterium]
MIPTIVIVGRPNVGKSTLFNRLTRSRDALVADIPGLTRDRHYGRGRVGGKSYIVVDTGGLEPVAHDGILHAMAQQTLLAVDEADAIVFMVDGRQGLTSQDRTIAGQLRRTGRRIWLVVNKTEGMQPATVNAEFHELALGDPLAISAAHGEGVSDLADLITADFPEPEQEDADAAPETPPRIAVVGRPNVGKSTLVNRMLGEERVLVYGEPGTTRDSIYIDFQRGGRSYTLIDTAGMRRRGNISDVVEKFSVIKTLQAIEDANVVILMLDAREQITDQDAHIAGYILEAGRALVVAVNKWDGLSPEQRDWAKRSLARTLNFIEFAPAHYISALAGTGIKPLFEAVEGAYEAAMVKLPTPKLTRALMAATTRQQPPRAGMSRPKLRYAHQGGSNPPRIVIHGTALNHISDSYRRYLERFFRDTFKLQGTPLKIEFRQGRNPYDTRRGGR